MDAFPSFPAPGSGTGQGWLRVFPDDLPRLSGQNGSMTPSPAPDTGDSAGEPRPADSAVPSPDASPGAPGNSSSTSGSSATSGPAPGASAGGTRPSAEARPAAFFGWVRQLGIPRGQDRWLGGVAAGIAQRTGLDPVLVRGLFIVLAFFGVGLLLYGLAWALLPEPDGRIHAEEALTGSWTAGMTGALAASLLGLGGPGVSVWAEDGLFNGLFWSLFWVGGAGLAIYWFSTRSTRDQAGAKGARENGHGGLSLAKEDADGGPAPQTAPSNASSDDSAGKDHYNNAQYNNTQYNPPYKTSLERGGSAPTGYPGYPGYPEAGYGSQPKPAPRPLKPRTTPTGAAVALILGTVLLAIGTVLALDYAGVVNLGSPWAAALAAAAVVNGLGIVVLGFMGRSSGVLGFTAVVALLAALLTGSGFTHANLVIANRAEWTPDATRSADEGYTMAAVDGYLDLSYLSSGTGNGIQVPVSVAVSDLTILVPGNIPVTIQSDLLASNIQINDGNQVRETGSMWRSAEQNLNSAASGAPLVVQIKGVASNVLVTVDESDMNS